MLVRLFRSQCAAAVPCYLHTLLSVTSTPSKCLRSHMAAAQTPASTSKALSSTKGLSHPHEGDDEERGEAIREAFITLAGQDGTQVSIDTLRSILQEFDLKMDLDESLQKLQDSKPRRGHLDEPLEVVTLDDFSSLFK